MSLSFLLWGVTKSVIILDFSNIPSDNSPGNKFFTKIWDTAWLVKLAGGDVDNAMV